MEYVYASLLLHSVGKKIDESGLASVLKATGANVDEARVKAMVAALEGVNRRGYQERGRPRGCRTRCSDCSSETS